MPAVVKHITTTSAATASRLLERR